MGVRGQDRGDRNGQLELAITDGAPEPGVGVTGRTGATGRPAPTPCLSLESQVSVVVMHCVSTRSTSGSSSTVGRQLEIVPTATVRETCACTVGAL